MLYANVVEIETDEIGRTVSCVHVRTLAGNTLSVSAKFFILAASGLENARLLLVSRRVRTCGIGNEHDLVGRFFMEHLHVPVGHLLPAKRQSSLHFYEKQKVAGISLQGALTLSDHTLRQKRLLHFSATLHNGKDPHDVFLTTGGSDNYRSFVFLLQSLVRGEFPDHWTHHMANVMSHPREVAYLVFRKLLKPTRSQMIICCRTEQAPNPASRLMLSEARDRLGMLKARLNWCLTEQDIDSLREGIKLMAMEFRHTNTGQMHLWEPEKKYALDDAIVGGPHQMGTTRMHQEPRRGVVDENCRVHGMSNLYVAGASVFPTSGWVNPTLTLVALALRLSDYIQGCLLP